MDISSALRMGSVLGNGGPKVLDIRCKKARASVVSRVQLNPNLCFLQTRATHSKRCTEPGSTESARLDNGLLPVFTVGLTPGVLEKMMQRPASPCAGLRWDGCSLRPDTCLGAESGEEPEKWKCALGFGGTLDHPKSREALEQHL